MDNKLLGVFYIFLGAILIFFVASEFIVRAAIVIFGIYLIYRGLELRNAQNFLFFIHRFRNRF